LGLSGVYNVFLIGENFKEFNIKSQSNERNLLVDSRTAIYKDVFIELAKQNSIIWGLGGIGKTNTSLKEDELIDYAKIYKEGRRYTESGMLNQFQFSGFIGAFSYWLLLMNASFNAIFKSKNIFFKLLGLFMAFKVTYSFVEDPIYPNVATFYLMYFIGLCYNKKIRSFDNSQIKKLSYIIFK
jgi:hypothetical protein